MQTVRTGAKSHQYEVFLVPARAHGNKQQDMLMLLAVPSSFLYGNCRITVHTRVPPLRLVVIFDGRIASRGTRGTSQMCESDNKLHSAFSRTRGHEIPCTPRESSP